MSEAIDFRKLFIQERLARAAAQAGAIEPDQVGKLLASEGTVDYDDEAERICVFSDSERIAPRLGSDGTPMTPEDLVSDFIERNANWRGEPSTNGTASGAQDQAGNAESSMLGQISARRRRYADALSDQNV